MSDQSEADTNTTPNLLLTLPAELRNRILQEVINHDAADYLHWRSHYNWNEVAILRLCKRICTETFVFYKPTNVFRVSITIDDLAEACPWVGHMALEADQLRGFGIIELRVEDMQWENFELLWPVAKLFFEVEFSRLGVSTVTFRYESLGYLQEVLNALKRLGERGRREGWTEKVLKEVFDGLIARRREKQAVRERSGERGMGSVDRGFIGWL